MQISMTPTPTSPPFVGEVIYHDDFIVIWTGSEWCACYREEEADEFGGEAFGWNIHDHELAIADLVKHFPREV